MAQESSSSAISVTVLIPNLYFSRWFVCFTYLLASKLLPLLIIFISFFLLLHHFCLSSHLNYLYHSYDILCFSPTLLPLFHLCTFILLIYLYRTYFQSGLILGNAEIGQKKLENSYIASCRKLVSSRTEKINHQ